MITEFEKGKWYEATTNSILKYDSLYDKYSPFGTYEWLNSQKKYNKTSHLCHTSSKIIREVPLSEILKFLPDDHPDRNAITDDTLLSSIIL